MLISLRIVLSAKYMRLIFVLETRRPHTASVIVNVGEKAMFEVTFKPSGVQRSQAHLHLTVIDNQFEDSVIQLVGEGYEDDITLDNIHSVQETSVDLEEGNMADDDITGKYKGQGHHR